MPEGPEVRRHAQLLDAALRGQALRAVEARTRDARAWLAAHPGIFEGQRVRRVWSRGKQLVGEVEGGLFFSSHLMMWGRWHVVAPDDDLVTTRDRRERARLVTDTAAALLFSAPVFVVGEGDPFAHVPFLATLGPDVLPEGGPDAFCRDEVRARMAARPERAVGAALLDQTVLAGVGNYLRAEILFACRLDPWTPVGGLDEGAWTCLLDAIPRVSDFALRHEGRTLPDAARDRVLADSALRHGQPRDWNARHHVFRRTNLPCLECGTSIRQLRQTTHVTDEGEARDRIIYFCPQCQQVDVAARRKQVASKVADA